ncbi:MAG: response regulator [Clostridia bacterium]|nr:response regulator [Clostridia bacterium]
MFNMIIVDDELSAAYELAELVDYSKYSFQVLGCFGDAESALAFIDANPVDLIISDIKMSDIDGIELLKIINNQYPYIKVVFISAYRDFEYAKLAVSHNAFEYLTKPISFTEYIDVLIRLKEVLVAQNSMLNIEENSLIVEEFLYDFFNNIITEDVFVKKMSRYRINYDILNSECSLVKLKICNLDDYLKKTWLHGVDRLSTAIKNIIPTSMYNCFIFTMSRHEDIITLIILSNNNINYEKNLNDLSAYIKSELQSLLCVDTTFSETHRCSSVFSLKNMLPSSTTYLVNTIMAHIINNRFDKISELRDSFFSSVSIEEQRNLCLQLTDSINLNPPNDVRINTINEVGVRSISNTSTLIMYFDEIISAFKTQNDGRYLEKAIILEAIRYIDANYSKEITLSSVSKHVMLNASYFSNFFKTQTGECFSDFLVKIRMEHAKDLLKNNPTMKIQTICENVGYKSQPYFYKIFQAYTGYSPSEYRKLKG